MEIFNRKSSAYEVKKKKIYLYIMISIAAACVLFLFLNQESKVENIKVRKQIFTYLKSVQPIEDEFYELLHNRANKFDQNAGSDYLEYLEYSIGVIDQAMLALADIEANPQIIENKLLFIEEMKAVRDMLFEEFYGVKESDEKSLMKSKAYLEEYQAVGRLRRESLKRIFDKYDIIYIDLGNRIKYKTTKY